MKQPSDNQVWFDLIKDIKPSKRTKYIKKEVTIKEVKPSINYSTVYSGDSLEELEHGQTNNIDKNTAKKFKRGEFKIEKSLDLHGYTENQAYDRVFSFIKSSYQQGLRCVLIVTGKGLKKQQDDDVFTAKGILREKVPQWLNSKELRPLILSYTHAQNKDGGTGALYVLIRRQRD